MSSNPVDLIQTRPLAIAPGKTSALRHTAPPVAGKPAVLLFPALGVPAKYYDKLLLQLAQAGVGAAVVDLQGQGVSSVQASRRHNFGYRELLEQDFPVAIATARELFGAAPLYVMGHSLGGQLACLYLGQHAARHPIAGLVLCASCSVYYRSLPSFKGQTFFLLGTQFAAALAKGMGYFPGHRLRFAGRTGQRLISDWAAQARTGNYRVQGSAVDWEGGLRQLRLPVLSITLEGDNLAPAGAADHLNGKLVQARITRHHLLDTGLNHFSWAKKPEAVLPYILPWLDGAQALDKAVAR
jgi:predicted alpha/beta hydrolase